MLSNKVVFTGTSSWLWETETRHCYLRISCSWISSEVRQCHSTNSIYIYIFCQFQVDIFPVESIDICIILRYV